MKTSLSFTFYATFSDDDACNPIELKLFENYLGFMGYGYEIYRRKHHLATHLVGQIQVFCSADNYKEIVYELNDWIKKLLDISNFVEESAIRVLPIKLQEMFVDDGTVKEQIEIKQLENQQEIATENQRQRNQKVELAQYGFDFLQSAPEISTASRQNGYDAERQPKRSAKKAKNWKRCADLP